MGRVDSDHLKACIFKFRRTWSAPFVGGSELDHSGAFKHIEIIHKPHQVRGVRKEELGLGYSTLIYVNVNREYISERNKWYLLVVEL